MTVFNEYVAKGVKANPRYRARMLRHVIKESAASRYGTDVDEVQMEFWARYNHKPNAALVRRQCDMLVRDCILVKASRGEYRLSTAGLPVAKPAPVIDPFS